MFDNAKASWVADDPAVCAREDVHKLVMGQAAVRSPGRNLREHHLAAACPKKGDRPLVEEA
jgi:hypothetical protein